MISLRLAVTAVLVAAAVAGCITYFVTRAPPKAVEAAQLLPPIVPNVNRPSRFGDIDEYLAPNYGRTHRCVRKSRRGYP
jgi:hypothetical protein